jgi:hypothetical protein
VERRDQCGILLIVCAAYAVAVEGVVGMELFLLEV